MLEKCAAICNFSILFHVFLRKDTILVITISIVLANFDDELIEIIYKFGSVFLELSHCTMNKTGSISGHFQKRTQIQLFQLGRITRKLPDLINLGDFGRRAIYFAFLV